MVSGPLNLTYDNLGINNVYSTGGLNSPSTVHKTFDLSNTAMESNKLRQFHQTRLYIQNFKGMVTRGAENSISDTRTYLLSANLPDTISYTLSSKWAAPLQAFQIGGMGNALMQFGSTALKQLGDLAGNNIIGKGLNWIGDNAKSGINRAGTMLVWEGNDPLELTLTIPVIDDREMNTNSQVGLNLTEALEFLSCLVLPKKESDLGYYTPPPSPLNMSLTVLNKTAEFKSTYARIILQLGGVLLIDNCIVKSVRVNYPNTKAMIKHYTTTGQPYLSPLFAEITLTISTLEGNTVNAYSRMLWLSSQPEEAAGSASIFSDSAAQQSSAEKSSS